jgi:ribosomal-protein-alanine N-acetyltransferase
VFLVSLEVSDGEELVALCRQSRLLHAQWVRPPRTMEAFQRFMARVNRPNARAFAIRRREDGALVGVAALSHLIRGFLQSAYLGYFALAPHAGQGYMTEGIGLVVRYAFKTLRLHRLEANIQPENAASRALAERCGFRLEGYSPRYLKLGGRWRDHERWAVTREDVSTPRAFAATRRTVQNGHRPSGPKGGGALSERTKATTSARARR